MGQPKSEETKAAIKASKEATKARRESMTLVTRDIKLDTNNAPKEVVEKLTRYFLEAKWLRNDYIRTQDFLTNKTPRKTIDVFLPHLNIYETRQVGNLPAQVAQKIPSQLINDVRALAAKKSKGGKVGKINFCKEVNSLEFSQYGVTHKFVGKKVKLAGIKRPFRAYGMEQLVHVTEFGNAKLVKRPDGFHFIVTCYISDDDYPKFLGENRHLSKTKPKKQAVGLDFGVATCISSSDGSTRTKHDMKIPESDSLKRAQRALSKKKKGSKNYMKAKVQLQKQYQKLTNQKNDMANKLVASLTDNYEVICLQDENLKGWHRGRFGKQVQQSCLGRVKAKIMALPAERVAVVPRYKASTKECFECGGRTDLDLNDRMFVCEHCGYTDDRDFKAAEYMIVSSGFKLNTAGLAGMNAHGDENPCCSTTCSCSVSLVAEVGTLISNDLRSPRL